MSGVKILMLVGDFVEDYEAMVPLQILLAATLGIASVAGAAAAMNCLVEQKIDAVMLRTRARPLPSGASPRSAPSSSTTSGAPSTKGP